MAFSVSIMAVPPVHGWFSGPSKAKKGRTPVVCWTAAGMDAMEYIEWFGESVGMIWLVRSLKNIERNRKE